MSQSDPQSEQPQDLAAKLITVTTAAQLSGLSTGFLRRLLRQGELPGVKLGKTWLTTEAAIRDYLAKDRRPGPKGTQ